MTKEVPDCESPREGCPQRRTRSGEGIWSILRELDRRSREPQAQQTEESAKQDLDQPGLGVNRR